MKNIEITEAHPNSKIYDKCWDGYRKVPGKKRGEKGSCEKVSEAYDAWDEADVWYKFDLNTQKLRQRSWYHAQEREARADGWHDSHDKAMRAHGYFPSKFKRGEYVKKGVDGNWIKVYPYADKTVKEFAPNSSGDSGDDGFSEETLKRFAAQWYNGNEDPEVEKTLAAAGWEIGQDEGYDDEPGVFVVQSGDINGRSYLSWPADELREGVLEMDSQGYRGHRGDEDPGKGPEKAVKPAKTKDVAKDAEKELTKAIDKAHKKGVTEGSEFGAYYYEQLAQQVFDTNKNLDATGQANEVMDAGYAIARRELGNQQAHRIFAYDEDFANDFVSAYAYLQQNKQVKEQNMPDNSLGYKNTLAVMKAADSSQEATINLGGEPVTLDYPEARFIAGKYKAFLRAGRQEEFFGYMANPQQFDSMMKQLRGLHDKQKAFKGSVPGERGVPGETSTPWIREGESQYDKSHGSPYDRGGADSWYSRPRNPHKGGVGGDSGPRVEKLTADEIKAYHAGYDDNEKSGGKKSWESAEKPVTESLRLVGKHGAGAKTAKVYKDHEWGEYRVKFYTDGKHEGEAADYHTDDKDDANDTAKSWTTKGEKIAESTYWCRQDKTRKLIPEGYKKTARGYITKI